MSKKTRVFNKVNFPPKVEVIRELLTSFKESTERPENKDTLSTFSSNLTEKKSNLERRTMLL